MSKKDDEIKRLHEELERLREVVGRVRDELNDAWDMGYMDGSACMVLAGDLERALNPTDEEGQ